MAGYWVNSEKQGLIGTGVVIGSRSGPTTRRAVVSGRTGRRSTS